MIFQRLISAGHRHGDLLAYTPGQLLVYHQQVLVLANEARAHRLIDVRTALGAKAPDFAKTVKTLLGSTESR